jgi:hypothetical protein
MLAHPGPAVNRSNSSRVTAQAHELGYGKVLSGPLPAEIDSRLSMRSGVGLVSPAWRCARRAPCPTACRVPVLAPEAGPRPVCEPQVQRRRRQQRRAPAVAAGPDDPREHRQPDRHRDPHPAAQPRQAVTAGRERIRLPRRGRGQQTRAVSTFEELVTEGSQVPADGRDFSWLEGRGAEKRSRRSRPGSRG